MTPHLDASVLLEASPAEWLTRADVAEHLQTCVECRARIDTIVEADAVLRLSLDDVATRPPSVDVMGRVLLRAERRTFWLRATLSVLILLLVFLISPWGRRSQVALGRWAESPPDRITETYPLHCLTPANAASLIFSRFDADGSEVRPVADGLSVVVVRATVSEHRVVARLLAQYDREGSVLCRPRVMR